MIGKQAVNLRLWVTLRAVIAVGAIIVLLQAKNAQAQIPVSIELVLAVDVSRSVDDVEYDLQMTGIAKAFRHPEIIDLIGQQNGVAVTLFQWDEEADRNHMIAWHLLSNRASVLSFAAKVRGLERSPTRNFTGIGKAIEFGVHLITENEFAGRQLKIDISGDGWDNIGSLPSALRQRAPSLGIAINGLPILTDDRNLEIYYREEVILGPGAFLEIAIDYNDFARAFLRKLRREITPFISRNYPTTRAAGIAGSCESEECPLRIAGDDRASLKIETELGTAQQVQKQRPSTCRHAPEFWDLNSKGASRSSLVQYEMT